ncbi:MAG: hypothetical protein AB1405_01870 [Bdellovibrionota bacterium]
MNLPNLLGIDTHGYDRWVFRLDGAAGEWLFILLALLLAASAGISFWHLRGRQRLVRRVVLLGLRWALLALLLVLFLEPELELLKTVPIRSQVLVAIDRTPSMTIPDAADGEERRKAVASALGEKSPWEEIEKDHDVRYLLFTGKGADYERAESARPAVSQGYEAEGSETDLSAALADLSKLSRERATAGVVLVTDGADLGALSELHGDPGQLASFLKRNDLLPAAPLSTVRVGGENAFPDLAIRRVIADEYGFIRNQVDVKVELSARGIGGKSVPITIRQGSEVLASARVELPASGGTVEAKLGFSPTRVGEFVYTVEVPVLTGERLPGNNRKDFKIKIIRDKVRVLHVVGRPSWDEQFLRRTLKQDPNIDLVSFMILRELVPIPFTEDELSLIPFPTDEIFNKKLHTFDLVIFQNFQYVPAYGILPIHLSNIRDFVVRDGGGFVMLGGEQSFSAGNYTGTPIEDILPVSLRYAGSLLEAGKGISYERFAPKPSAAGRLHPLMRLHLDPQRSSEIWASLPPLDGMNRVGDLSAGAVALLTHPSLRTPTGQPAPVVSAASVGKGRSLAIAADTTWYWSYFPVDAGGTNEAYLSFWREAIRWLTKDPALKQLNVTTDRSRYRPGEEMHVEVGVLSPEYSPVSDADVKVQAKSMSGEVVCQEKARSLGEGRYETRCKASGAGYLEIQAEAFRGGISLGTDSAYVEVVAESREFERTEPDGELLSLLADLGNGVSLSITDGKLSGSPKLKDEQAYKVLGSHEVSLWDTPIALVLALVLAILEWWLRRRWGLA